MNNVVELRTQRLILRQWSVEDYSLFAEMNANDEVMKYFPKPLNESESNQLAVTLSNLLSQRGWGLWALEEISSKTFIGFTGLHDAPRELTFSPATEIGWRLSRQCWGNGYATEAAQSVLAFAFERLSLDQVVSFTSVINKPSRDVMKRINMVNTGRNFFHPAVPAKSPLREHVLYTISKKQWATHA